MVVEDDPSIRDALESTLIDEGHQVCAVSHGREALEALRTWPADLILLDLMLPIMDGWVFLAERRRLELAPNARIVIVSATRQARNGDARALGVDAVIPKPFDLDTLLTTTARLLDQTEHPR
jgi:two-component system, chemotaxis family, chemotaxis protein CheY